MIQDEPATTIDKLLNGRFALEQPKKGYRIAVDTLLLAAAVPARAGERLLDLGCGVGGVMLAVATRVSEVAAVGLEIQPLLAELCARNILRNAFQDRLALRLGDVARLPEDFLGAFDHVALNPPYHDPARHGASQNECKRRANTESEEADLACWIAAAARALKEGGTMNLIHRADRVDEILALAAPLFGEIRVKMIQPKTEGPARRVIVRAKKEKDAAKKIVTEEVFILYGPDGRYGVAAAALLREAGAME